VRTGVFCWFHYGLPRRPNCVICVSELLQGESDEATKFFDGSVVLGQFCSLTLEA